jgi:two-component system OmpR family sensor kinase
LKRKSQFFFENCSKSTNLQSKMPLSFRAKLTVWYTVFLSGLLIISAFVLIWILQDVATKKLDATLWLIGSSEAEGISARMRDRGISDPDDLAVRDVNTADLPGYDLFRLQKYVTIVSQSHHVADVSLNLANQPLPYNDEDVSRALEGQILFQTVKAKAIGDLRVVYIPVVGRQNQLPFVVIVGIPTEFVGAELKTLTFNLFLIILIFLILAAATGWILARWTMQPVRETAAAVRKISERNLHERLPQPETHDEIDNLVRVFNQLLSRLENSFEMQKRFTADASHEINTPLTTLKGQTEVALLTRRTPEEYEKLLQSNLDEIERLSQLVTNLLVLARADSGEQQTSSEVLPLNTVVEAVFRRFQTIAADKKIEMSLAASEPIYVFADQTAVEQIVSNLLQNAVRYTPANGKIWVKVFLNKNETAVVQVRDNGIGIDSADIPHVFERFYRASNARSQNGEGSGLGLSISNLLAAALGGKITVESRAGQGSNFSLMLPALIFSPE